MQKWHSAKDRLQGCSCEGLSVKQGRQKNQTRNKFARGTWKGQTLGRRQLMRQEGNSGTRKQEFVEQLCLGSKRTTSRIDRKTIGLEIMKRAVGIFSGLQKSGVGPCGGVGSLQNGRT
jgi:hypothetical protein